MIGIDLKGLTALVTGGSRGIGEATSKLLGRAGARVIVNYLKDEEAAHSTTELIKSEGGEAFALRADVSSIEETAAMASDIFERFGGLDLLVCNAGIWEGAPVEEMTEELWDKVLEINLKGTWTVCRAFVPYMKRQKSGRIVVVSSTAGQRGESEYSSYAASKGGQIAFVKSLAVELASFGINVNAVAPGWVDTEMCEGVLADREYRRKVEESIPFKRIATPEDVALPILFLCSDWSRHMTGAVLSVNGGAVL